MANLAQRLLSGFRGFGQGFAHTFDSAVDKGPRGSRYGRRSALFEQSRKHINSDIATAGGTLRARTRFLCRENAYIVNAARVWRNYAVGTGWRPQVVHAAQSLPAALHAAFKQWCKVCDIDGRLNFYAMQAMVADEDLEAGEVFFRLIPDPDVGLKIQVIQSEQLPYSTIAASPLATGHVVRLGIEFDADGKRVAYHFYKKHPGDGTISNVTAGELMRVPAAEIIHVFTQTHGGQIRGYTRLAAAIVPSFKLDEYEDALIERAAQSAKYIGFIKRPGNTDDPVKADDDPAGPGARTFNMESGVIYELEPDEEFTESKPPDPGSGYDEFTRRQATKICIAVGTPYAESSGDVASANFSSTRVGRQPFKRECLTWGQNTLVTQFCDPVWEAWLRYGMLAGSISLPRGASRSVDSYLNVNWTPPSWEYVNPLDDVKADEIAVANGFKPRPQVQVEGGGDPDEVDQQIADAQDRADRLKLRIGPISGKISPLPPSGPPVPGSGAAPDSSGAPNDKPAGSQGA